MNAKEHRALTGHDRYSYLEIDEIIEISRQVLGRNPTGKDPIPDLFAECCECGHPITQSSLVAAEEDFANEKAWLLALSRENYIDQVELMAHGVDTLPVLPEAF